MSTPVNILDDLVAYWKLEEASGNAFDETRRGNDLIRNGTPGRAAAIKGYGIDLTNASAQWLGINDTADLSMGAGQSFTILGWVKLKTTALDMAIFAKAGPTPATGAYVLLYDNGGQFRFLTSATGTAPWSEIIATDVTPSADVWYFLRADHSAVDGTNRLIINEGTPNVLHAAADALNEAGQFRLGAAEDGASRSCDAVLDNWAVYKRVLTDVEGDWWYNAGAGNEPIIPITGALQFGSYVFVGSAGDTSGSRAGAWYIAEDPSSRVVPVVKLPRADGARALTGYREGKRIVIRGAFVRGPFSDAEIRPLVDALRGALAAGPQNLYVYADRYYRQMQCTNLAEVFEATWWNRIDAQMSIELIGPDPFQYSIYLRNDSWPITGAGQTHTVQAGGNAYAMPAFSLTVGGAGDINLDATITNDTSGESFRLAGAVQGGDVIVVDGLEQTVVIGADDRMDLFDGQWLRLEVGDNSISETYAAGTITEIAPKWRNRWW